MFSGIVETTEKINKVVKGDELVRVTLSRPKEFSDIKIGDSVACNGVCLTVESFDEKEMLFAIAYETLNITSWTVSDLKGKEINLERSLAFGDRIHGHLVAGHVECMTEVIKSYEQGESWIMEFKNNSVILPFLWKKGSVTINGVALTINEVDKESFSVCLIPETMSRTNLGNLKPGDQVCLEPDYFARALYHWKENLNA
ncbi:MAG: riboflavin synthase [Bdellovibrionales bacterium]